MESNLTIQSIKFEPESFNAILRSFYKGFNFNSDLLKINSVRKSIVTWNRLTDTKKNKTLNDVTILCNVYHPDVLIRFYLSNLDKSYWWLILELFQVENRTIHDINGTDVSIKNL